MKRPAAALTLVCLVAVSSSRAQDVPSPVSPFVEPPFENLCVLRHFEEAEAPPIDSCTDDPLCVEYEKRDITFTNGGAVEFLAAEPARFAIAIPKCRYWQQDHWRIQLNPGDVPLVAWDGSYWFNKGNGTGAARMRNFAINGQPADPGPAADVVQLFSPEMADVIRTYGESPTGGGGASFELGYGDPTCAQPAGTECDNDLAVSATRALVDEQCDCAGAASRRDYANCAEAVIASEVAGGRLPEQCESKVNDCARNSVCGRPDGSVTCCTTDSDGAHRCRVKRDASKCRAPSGGTASVGSGASCCDPCMAQGCQ